MFFQTGCKGTNHFTSKPLAIQEQNDSTDTTKVLNKDIYKLIKGGVESDIKAYFRETPYETIVLSDSGAIVSALNKLNPKEKVTHTIWILEEVKNRPFDIKKYIYSQLEKVNYSKPSFVLKQLINNYFVNFNENEPALSEKVSSIQKRMNKR